MLDSICALLSNTQWTEMCDCKVMIQAIPVKTLMKKLSFA